MVTFTDNVDFRSNGSVNPNYAYRDSSAGIISVFWVGLGKAALGVSTKNQFFYPQIIISPNPVSDNVRISGISRDKIRRIELYTIAGSKILDTDNLNFTVTTLVEG